MGSLLRILVVGFVSGCSSTVDVTNVTNPLATSAEETQFDRTPGNPPADAIPLADLFSESTIQPRRVVKTCGWTTNQFEDTQISLNLEDRYQYESIGFGLVWLSAEPRTSHPEWRCITGRIRPVCGWEDHTSCISNGTVHLYEIVQTELARD